jgi:hypothetical protein
MQAIITTNALFISFPSFHLNGWLLANPLCIATTKISKRNNPMYLKFRLKTEIASGVEVSLLIRRKWKNGEYCLKTSTKIYGIQSIIK